MFTPLKKTINARPVAMRLTNSVLIKELHNAAGPELINRNPRNLERLRIAPKLQGFTMDDKPTNFWNRYVKYQCILPWQGKVMTIHCANSE